MSAESGTNRWWENYLVRYLMPSIAGVVIVYWLCSHGGDSFRSLLRVPAAGSSLDAPSLTLMFLYGNLFCYVASYPILVFHATREIDFTGGRWRANLLRDGYTSSLALLLLACVFFRLGSPALHFYGAFVLASAMTTVQFCRLRSVMSPRIRVRGLRDMVSPAFGYAYSLARRRGLLHVTESDQKTKREIAWRQDLIATYRHLREHGNSAFIFLLELTLAVLVYFVIRKPGQTAEQQLGAIGGLFAIWAAPAVFVHLLGQHLERRFSRFDERLVPTQAAAAISSEPGNEMKGDRGSTG